MFIGRRPTRNRGRQRVLSTRPNAYQDLKKRRGSSYYERWHPRIASPLQNSRIQHASKLRSCTILCEKCDLPLRTLQWNPLRGTISNSSTVLRCSNALAFIANGSMRVSELPRNVMNTSQNMNVHTTALTSAVRTQYLAVRPKASLRTTVKHTTSLLSQMKTFRCHQSRRRRRHHLLIPNHHHLLVHNRHHH